MKRSSFISLTLSFGIALGQFRDFGPLPQAVPRVNPDLTVTYFYNAPNANEVILTDSVHSQWPPGLRLTKGPDGIWTLTTPPYEPGTHQYGFLVDGIPTGLVNSSRWTDRMPHPFTYFELVDVRGSEPLPYDLAKVPHGIVHIETFSSTRFGREVPCYVYTPPGYESSGKRYPVLYLLHGNAAEASHWTTLAYANRITDNLIGSGASSELIIVMPDTGTSARGNQTLALVESYLLEEVMPFVEGRYRALPEQSARYLAGLSAGANHTRNIGLRHPELFSALGIFSGGGIADGLRLEDTYGTVKDGNSFNNAVRLVYVAIGNEDGGLAGVENLRQSLERLGIRHDFVLSTGGHNYFNFHRYLVEFLKRL